MPQFGFYRVGSNIETPLTIVTATGLEDVKRQARVAIEAEGLDAIRLWIDGEKTIEVRQPSRQVSIATRSPAKERGVRMVTKKAQGATLRAIGKESGISEGRVKQIIAVTENRARLHEDEPNRAALSARARNALRDALDEPERDPGERDKRLPGRVAAFSRRDMGRLPNIGKLAVSEIEAWLWDRGLSFNG